MPLPSLPHRRSRLEEEGKQDEEGYTALAELSAALDYVLPAPPAWSFAPLPHNISRLQGHPADRGFGAVLSFDITMGLVKKRVPGAGLGWWEWLQASMLDCGCGIQVLVLRYMLDSGWQ